MKPFQFTLEPVRVLRQQKERNAQQRYAEALRACEQAASRVQGASEELSACWTDLRSKMAAGVAGTELLRARAWCNVLELKLKECAATLEKARLATDSMWQEMMDASRKREALDRHRDKKKRVHNRGAQRLELKMLDELAVHLPENALQPGVSNHQSPITNRPV